MQLRNPKKNELFSGLIGCLFIGLLSLAAGLGSNLLRPSPLPLIPPFVFEPSYQEISLEQAQTSAKEGVTIFLDSRNNPQYKLAHLPQALNLPVKDFSALYPVLDPLLPGEGWIVIYGEGWGRPTEKELAYLLSQAGKTKIKVLKGGLRAWKEKGYPLEGK